MPCQRSGLCSSPEQQQQKTLQLVVGGGTAHTSCSRSLWLQGLQTSGWRSTLGKAGECGCARGRNGSVYRTILRLSRRMWIRSQSGGQWQNQELRSRSSRRASSLGFASPRRRRRRSAVAACCLFAVCCSLVSLLLPFVLYNPVRAYSPSCYQRRQSWFSPPPPSTHYCCCVGNLFCPAPNSFLQVRKYTVPLLHGKATDNDDENDNDETSNEEQEDEEIEVTAAGQDGVMIDDLVWRVTKLRLEEENTRRFLRARPRFLPYDECRRWVQAWGQRWECEEDWRNWIAMGEKRNAYIPSQPDQYYGRLGQWVSWQHFLGTNRNDTKYELQQP